MSDRQRTRHFKMWLTDAAARRFPTPAFRWEMALVYVAMMAIKVLLETSNLGRNRGEKCAPMPVR